MLHAIAGFARLNILFARLNPKPETQSATGEGEFVGIGDELVHDEPAGYGGVYIQQDILGFQPEADCIPVGVDGSQVTGVCGRGEDPGKGF